MNERPASLLGRQAVLYGEAMKISAYTPYERKALIRFRGLAQCLGLRFVSATFADSTRTLRIVLDADKESCLKFAEAASKRVRMAEYKCAENQVFVTFTSHAAAGRIPLEKRAAVGLH